MLHAQEISPDVWWVGGLDWNERSFHGYTTEMGITYNAYLILDEHITLIDTTKQKFSGELMDRISELVDPTRIEYIVSNHVEMDHSGALPDVLKLCPQATVITSAPHGVKGLTAHFGTDVTYQGVKTGDVLNIGKRTLTFIQTPMVHWPDNMVTYSEYDQILFSNDAFGQHLATSQRFDYQNDKAQVMHQAKKYYANIVQPYAAQAKRALDAVKVLDITLIAPSHGVIWKEYIDEIFSEYEKWTTRTVTNKCVVIYDTMWHSTEKMAQCITSAAMSAGIECHLYDLKKNHASDIMTELLDARFVAIGSPTLNSQTLPTVASFLCYLKGLSPKNDQRIGFAFGSYGWAPIGPKTVYGALEDMKFEMLCDCLSCNWKPSDDYLDDLEKCITEIMVG